MQIEGTETPTALSPITAGDGGKSTPADNTTQSNVVVFEEVHVYGDAGSDTKTPVTSPANETQSVAPQASVDTKQATPESISPVTQTQRSEATVPTTQDTSGNSGSSSSFTTQNSRGNSTVSQVQAATSVPNFTPFDSSLAGAPKREQVSSSTQADRSVLPSPDWLSDPFTPHNPALQDFPFDRPASQKQGTATVAKPKRKRKKDSGKKATEEPKQPDEFKLIIDGKEIPLQDFGKPPENETEEQKAKREYDEVLAYINKYTLKNPGRPIPLTKDQIIRIIKYDIIRLQREEIPADYVLSDSIFWNLGNPGINGGLDHYKYLIKDEIGGNAPGVYGGNEINYIFQGITTAFNGGESESNALRIGIYNFFKGILPGVEHDPEIIQNFGRFGYDYYKANY